MLVNSLEIMGNMFVYSILSLEDFEFYDIIGNLGKFGNLGKKGQNGLFNIFVLNYDIKALLRHIGCMGNEN